MRAWTWDERMGRRTRRAVTKRAHREATAAHTVKTAPNKTIEKLKVGFGKKPVASTGDEPSFRSPPCELEDTPRGSEGRDQARPGFSRVFQSIEPIGVLKMR